MKTKTYFFFLVDYSTKQFSDVFHSFEKLLQLMYVREPKNKFVKMSKKLTNFFKLSKENTSV